MHLAYQLFTDDLKLSSALESEWKHGGVGIITDLFIHTTIITSCCTVYSALRITVSLECDRFHQSHSQLQFGIAMVLVDGCEHSTQRALPTLSQLYGEE